MLTGGLSGQPSYRRCFGVGGSNLFMYLAAGLCWQMGSFLGICLKLFVLQEELYTRTHTRCIFEIPDVKTNGMCEKTKGVGLKQTNPFPAIHKP